MDFGIFIPPLADSWKSVKRAEELGYTRAWFYDTPLLNSELFASMAAALVFLLAARKEARVVEAA